MSKRIRPASTYQDRRDPLRLLADRNIKPMGQEVLRAYRDARKLVDPAKAAQAIRNGRMDLLHGLLDKHHLRETLKPAANRIGNVIFEAGRIGAERLTAGFRAKGLPIRFRQVHRYGRRSVRLGLPIHKADALLAFEFSQFDAATLDIIQQIQGWLLQYMSQDAVDAIGAAVQDGLARGLRPEQIAETIKEYIGLAPSQMTAVSNYRAQLETLDSAALDRKLIGVADLDVLFSAIASGEALPSDAIDALTQNYADNYLAYRADTIATTEMTRASSIGLQESYRQAVDRGAIPEEAVTQHWRVAMDERVCPICLSIPDMNPDGVGIGEDFDSIDGPVQAPPVHVNCLPGNAVISPGQWITAASARPYDGDLVVLGTAGGKELSCTPNHPVLTRRGWVAARLLGKGDYVVCGDLRDGMLRADHDHNHAEASIEQIADALGRSSGMGTAEMPITAEDFHGDARDGDVAVIYADRSLLRDDLTLSPQEVGKRLLVRAASALNGLVGLRAEGPLLPGVRSAARRVMGSLRKREAILGGRLRHPAVHAFAAVRDGNPGLAKDAPDSGAAYSLGSGDRQHGLPGVERGDNPASVNLGPPLRPRYSGLGYRVGLGEPTENGVADAILAGDIFNGRWGSVELDEIVDIGRVPFSGHVYNLETRLGFYVANGIVTHNCRCSIEVATNLDLVPDDAVF